MSFGGADEDVIGEGLEDGIVASMTEVNPKMVNQYFIWFAYRL